MSKKKKRKLKIDLSVFKRAFKYNAINFILPLAIVLILGIAVIVFIEAFKVNTVTVEGAKHYSDQEIIDYVLDSKLSRNSVFLNLKYKNKSIKDVPFVEKIDVNIIDKNTVEIMVYEKYLAGCIANLGNYLYFDNDGIIVEVSKTKTARIPVVTGLQFEYFNVYEPLPVENPDVFRSILDITKLLDKYSLDADIINYGDDMTVTIFFDEVRVYIGDGQNIDEKFMVLPSILPSLEGKKGVLHMEKYSESNGNIVFNEDV